MPETGVIVKNELWNNFRSSRCIIITISCRFAVGLEAVCFIGLYKDPQDNKRGYDL